VNLVRQLKITFSSGRAKAGENAWRVGREVFPICAERTRQSLDSYSIPVTPVRLGCAAQECCGLSLFPQLTCKAHSTRQGAQMQVCPNLCPFCTLTCSRKDLCKTGSSLPCPAERFTSLRLSDFNSLCRDWISSSPSGKILPSPQTPRLTLQATLDVLSLMATVFNFLITPSCRICQALCIFTPVPVKGF